MSKPEDNVVKALIKNKVIKKREDILEITSISAGILNYPFIVKTKDMEIFCKYSDSVPRILKAENYPADRLEKEADAIKIIKSLTGHNENFPSVLFYDKEYFVIAMRSAKKPFELLDDQLHKGFVDRNIAGKLGEIIAKVHNNSLNNNLLKIKFNGIEMIEKVRGIESYSEVSKDKVIENNARELYKELLSRRMCLVHGDYKPNNMIIERNNNILIIDFEICYYGNPVLDTSLNIGFYIIHSLSNLEKYNEYFGALEEFWDEYRKNSKFRKLDELEYDTIKHAGVNILSRLDGRLKRESIQTEFARNILRPLANDMILGKIRKVNDLRKNFERYLKAAV